MEHFLETGLGDNMLKAIRDLGFENPTPVQAEVIPVIRNTTKNIIVISQTGTGKTAAFGLPLLDNIDFTKKIPQGLILCPTRELCIQITNDLNSYAKYLPEAKITSVYGGADIVGQIRVLKEGVHIVAGTPGRVIDLIKRKSLKLHNINWLVLDEADEMLNMGFQEDLDTILAETPKVKRTLLFSATMPKQIRKIADDYMDNPYEITVGNRNVSTTSVKHEYFMVKAKDRYLALKRIADIHPGIYSIVFCRTRMETKDIAGKLIQDGYNADALHGDLSQAQRDHVMDRFRNRSLEMLVATDVAARGLDVRDLTHVINYNLPDDPEAYIHRSGRTGRAGKTGISMSIIHAREFGRIRDLEKLTGASFHKRMVPAGKNICEKQLFHLIDKMENIDINNEQIDGYLKVIYKKLEWLNREDLIKRFVSVEFNRFLDYYKNAEDININIDKKDNKAKLKDKKSEKEFDESNFTKLHINVGSKHNLNPAGLISLINDHCKKRRVKIGKIDIQRNFSFFDMEKSACEKVINGFNGKMYNNTLLEVNLAVNNKRKRESKQQNGEKPFYQKFKKEKQRKTVSKKKNDSRRQNVKFSS